MGRDICGIDALGQRILHKRTRLAGVNMSEHGAVCDAVNQSRRKKLDRSQSKENQLSSRSISVRRPVSSIGSNL